MSQIHGIQTFDKNRYGIHWYIRYMFVVLNCIENVEMTGERRKKNEQQQNNKSERWMNDGQPSSDVWKKKSFFFFFCAFDFHVICVL